MTEKIPKQAYQKIFIGNSNISEFSVFLTVSSIYFLFSWRLVDLEYGHDYQYDVWVFPHHAFTYVKAFRAADFSLLQPLEFWPPYLDLYNLLVAVVLIFDDYTGALFGNDIVKETNLLDRGNAIIRWMSVFFHSTGGAFLTLLLRRLSGSLAVALLIGAITTMAPVMLSMDFGRNDFALMGLLCASLYFLTLTLNSKKLALTATGLAVASALLMTTKLNGPTFGLIPFAGALIIKFYHKRSWRFVTLFCTGIAIMVSLVSIRQLYYYTDFIGVLQLQIQDLQRWAARSPNLDPFYYSWSILSEFGIFYRILIWLSILMTPLLIFANRRTVDICFFAVTLPYVLTSFTISYAFARGGYHLLPMFAGYIAILWSFLTTPNIKSTVLARLKPVTAVASYAVFAMLGFTAFVVSKNYVDVAQARHNRYAAVEITRKQPERFLKALAPGARISYLLNRSSTFLPDVGISLLSNDKGLFRFDNRYELLHAETEAFKTYAPPTVSELADGADIFLLTDSTKTYLDWALSVAGSDTLLKDWNRLFDQLREQKLFVKFEAQNDGYQYKKLEIFILDPAIKQADVDRALVQSISGLAVGPRD